MTAVQTPGIVAEQIRIAEETVQRLAADRGLDLFDREEIGHDTIGAVPPSTAEAADEIAPLRRTVVSTMPSHTEEILRREVEITTLGRKTVAEWLPVIVGHLVHHRDQLQDVLRSRGGLPARFDRSDPEQAAARAGETEG
jgi:uncharacterized damage-inducible protein DinB